MPKAQSILLLTAMLAIPAICSAKKPGGGPPGQQPGITNANPVVTVKSPKEGKIIKRKPGKGFNCNVRVNGLIPKTSYVFAAQAVHGSNLVPQFQVVPVVSTNGTTNFVTNVVDPNITWVESKSRKANRKGFANFVVKKIGTDMTTNTAFEIWSVVKSDSVVVGSTSKAAGYTFSPNGPKR